MRPWPSVRRRRTPSHRTAARRYAGRVFIRKAFYWWLFTSAVVLPVWLLIGWAAGAVASAAGIFGSFLLDAPTGAVMVRRSLTLRRTLLPARQRHNAARYLVVTEGALVGARITLSGQPVLIGRADDSTLVLTDDYASTRHARLSQRGSEWYVEDLGSTNGTYLDRAKVTTAVRVPIGTPVRIGKTVIELRP